MDLKEITIKKVVDPLKIHKVDYSAVAKASDSSEHAVVYTLKQIAMAVETAMKKCYNVKLNLKIGHLKFTEHSVFFDNLGVKQDPDALTKTSCST